MRAVLLVAAAAAALVGLHIAAGDPGIHHDTKEGHHA